MMQEYTLTEYELQPQPILWNYSRRCRGHHLVYMGTLNAEEGVTFKMNGGWKGEGFI
jgi:hypothetical protein